MQNSSQSPDRRKAWAGPIIIISGLCLLLMGVGMIFLLRDQALSPSNPVQSKKQAGAQSENRRANLSPADPVQVELTAKSSLVLSTNAMEAALISVLFDPKQELKSRRKAARALAKLDSDAATVAVQVALKSAPPHIKAAIAEGLGENSSPEASQMLLDILNCADETAARGAVRGLAIHRDDASVKLLIQAFQDAGRPESIRTEAALALGDVDRPEALAALSEAAYHTQSDTMEENILRGIGKMPFSETESFFEDYVGSDFVSKDLKLTALQGLIEAGGDAVPFLLQYAANSDPEIRLAAAWGLAAAGDYKDIAPDLLQLLKTDTDPAVRARLYLDLVNQKNLDEGQFLALARSETNPDARVAVLTLLASECHGIPSAETLSFFEGTAVPELKHTALSDTSQQTRLAATMALRQARTPGSFAALDEIVQKSPDWQIVQAAQEITVNSRRTDQ
jgi:HEAT repeat protein